MKSPKIRQAGLGAILLLLAGGLALQNHRHRFEDPAISPRPQSPAGPTPPAPRSAKLPRKTPSPAVESLCERLARAEKYGTRNEVHRKVVSELSELDAATLLAMLEQIDSAERDDEARFYVRPAVFNALWGNDRVTAANYLVSSNDPSFAHFTGSLVFDGWAHDDLEDLIRWLDEVAHRDDRAGELSYQAETAVVTALATKDPDDAMRRLKTIPAAKVRDVVLRAFGQRSSLLPPDETITFLREALSNRDHVLGSCCGSRFHDQDNATIQAFFEKHRTTRQEGEAILFETARIGIMMGRGDQPVADYHDRMRSFAVSLGFDNADDISAVILGVASDRHHRDKEAVDQLLGYDPPASALEIFPGERSLQDPSFDPTQRARITERLKQLENAP